MCVGGNKPVEIQLFNLEFPLRGTRTDALMETAEHRTATAATDAVEVKVTMCPYRWNSSQRFRLRFWFVFHTRRPSLTRTVSSGATASWSGAAEGVILVKCRAVVDDCWCLAHLASRLCGTSRSMGLRQKKSRERYFVLANSSILASLGFDPPLTLTKMGVYAAQRNCSCPAHASSVDLKWSWNRKWNNLD